MLEDLVDRKNGAALLKNLMRFFKGTMQFAPPIRHRFPAWNLCKVLHTVTKMPSEPLKSTEFVATTSATRILEQGTSSVRCELCIFLKDSEVVRMEPSCVSKVALAIQANGWYFLQPKAFLLKRKVLA